MHMEIGCKNPLANHQIGKLNAQLYVLNVTFQADPKFSWKLKKHLIKGLNTTIKRGGTMPFLFLGLLLNHWNESVWTPAVNYQALNVQYASRNMNWRISLYRWDQLRVIFQFCVNKPKLYAITMQHLHCGVYREKDQWVLSHMSDIFVILFSFYY